GVGPRRNIPARPERPPSRTLDRGTAVERVQVAPATGGQPGAIVRKAPAQGGPGAQVPVARARPDTGRAGELHRAYVVVVAGVEEAEVVRVDPLHREPLGPGRAEGEMGAVTPFHGETGAVATLDPERVEGLGQTGCPEAH